MTSSELSVENNVDNDNQSSADITAVYMENSRRYLVPTYKPRELVVDHAQGAYVYDIEGKEYIDLGTGISVNSFGHHDVELYEALVEQAKKVWHTSNVYLNQPAVDLAQDIVENSFADRVFFGNSGAEANEAAIKTARKYAHTHFSSQKHNIITFKGSFHGRTLATVTATAQPKYQEGFEPLPGGFKYCAFNDYDAISEMVDENTCAIMVEPIQGEGGVIPANPGFLAHLRALCDEYNALLILDEIQCGIARTGQPFAYQWEPSVKPDIVTLAKALGGGMPIGAMLTTEKVADVMQFGTHGTTFGGNPVACAVASVIWKRIHDTEILANVRARSEQLQSILQNFNQNTQMFTEVRGRGLMLGAQLSDQWKGKAGEMTEAGRRHGVMFLQAGPDVLRFLPPLNIDEESLAKGMGRVEKALLEFSS